MANVSSVSQGATIIHTCESKDYDECTLVIGVADLDTTIKSEGKVIIGSARNRLNVEADFIQVASMGGYSELSSNNGVWIQSDLGVYSKAETAFGNVTVEGDVYTSFITAIQGNATVNGDLIDAARAGELGITAQKVTINGDYDPEYATILELSR